MGAYDDPEVYELAFSFVDVPKQVDQLTRLLEKHSKVKVHRVLDLGCGPSPQLREFARRGYEAVGLDLSEKMLDLLRKRANEENLKVEAVHADMVHFSLPFKVDLALNLMGTISLVGSRAKMSRHIASVANVLRSGGLYVIENYRLGWSEDEESKPQIWEMKLDGVSVKTIYTARHRDMATGTFLESIMMEVDDHGDRRTITDASETTIITPEKLRTMIEGRFEMIGFLDHGTGEPAKQRGNFNYLALRRL